MPPSRPSSRDQRSAASSERIIALTGPTEAGAMEIDRKPSPTSAIASSGFPAISPQSVSGTLFLAAASTMDLSAISAAGLSGS